jgi:hypothetical protein
MDTRKAVAAIPFVFLLLGACTSTTNPMSNAGGTRMEEQLYTLGVWHVKEGREAEFVIAWKELGAVFASLPQPPSGKGVLIQSVTDPTLFYSFGPWRSASDVAAMRADSRAQAGIQKIRDLCTEATPGMFRVVAESQ